MLFAAGGALAIAQPGDLGDDDETAAPVQETTTTTTEGTEPTTTTTTVDVTTTVPGETTTTMSGSGLGEETPPSGGTDGVANTGAESMLGAGMALGALGLLLRRATRAA